MTVREFINHLNPEYVLQGKISFKVIEHDNDGQKWFFYSDQKENPSKTIDEFCNHEGIKNCMNLEIMNDGFPVECFPEYEENVMHFKIDCFNREKLEKELKCTD